MPAPEGAGIAGLLFSARAWSSVRGGSRQHHHHAGSLKLSPARITFTSSLWPCPLSLLNDRYSTLPDMLGVNLASTPSPQTKPVLVSSALTKPRPAVP